MVHVENAQCGLCSRFSKNRLEPQIFQIRSKEEAVEMFTAACGHPKHEALNCSSPPTAAARASRSLPNSRPLPRH